MENFMRHIVLAINGYKNNIHPEFVRSVTETVRLGQENNIIFYFDHEPSDINESFQRNVIANKVLNSKVVEGVLFVNPMISWKASDVLKLIDESLNDVISGVYPLITYGVEEYPVILEEGYDITGTHIPLEATSMGFTYVPKAVFEAVKDSVEVVSENENMKFYYFFDPGMKDGKYLEDVVAFCSRVKESGFKVLLDPTVNCQNFGIIGLSSDYQKYAAKHWVEKESYGDSKKTEDLGPILDEPSN
jgi:hypothetical protein